MEMMDGEPPGIWIVMVFRQASRHSFYIESVRLKHSNSPRAANDP